MKIRDIYEGQVWSGIKQIGKGLGNVVGGTAMAGLRGLDKLGGGTGQIGTAGQQAAYTASEKARASAQVSKKLPQAAAAEFAAQLAQFGIDLSDARTFNPKSVVDQLENFGLHYFGTGQPTAIENYIKKAIYSIPDPVAINKRSILQYFTRVNQLKDDAVSVMNRAALVRHPADDLAPAEKKAETPTTAKPVTSPAVTPVAATGSPAGTEIRIPSSGEVVTKSADGRWYDADGDFIGNPADIAQLEKMAKNRAQIKQSMAQTSNIPNTPSPINPAKAAPSTSSRKRKRK